MAFSAEGTAKSSREEPTPGTHVARLIGIVDLGHQPAYQGEGWAKEDQHELEFTYELVDHKMKDGRPFLISESMKRSDADTGTGITSTLVARCKSLLGLDDFKDGIRDMETLVGQPCMVSVVPKPKNPTRMKIDGKAGVGSIPANMPVTEPENPTFVFNRDEPDMDLWEKMLDWKKERIQSALDFNDTALARRLAEGDQF